MMTRHQWSNLWWYYFCTRLC